MPHSYQGFEPNWMRGDLPKRSYRSIFKWGDPDYIKTPRESLYTLLKETFGMEDSDFQSYRVDLGLDEVKYDIPSKLSAARLDALRAIVGADFVRTDDYARLSVAYGKTMYDIMRLREKRIDHLPDAVLYPDSKEQIEQIVAYCAAEKIPVYVYGGGSSVTRGVECVAGGVSLDLRLRFCKVVRFNETDQTITVEAGMSGPRLEETLNNAQALFGSKRAYTCGHFPQSFEFSSVGGWVVTRGAGQNSTYYGTISDIVLGQEYATPTGVVKTDCYPRKATGPDLGQILMGGEGAFGVLTHVTLRVFRHLPNSIRRFSCMFPDWETGQRAAREIMQAEAGHPSVFRLSDPEETGIMLRMYGVADSPLRHLFRLKGYKEGEMCLFLGLSNGERGFSKNCAKNARRICRQFGGVGLTGLVTSAWEKGRFSDPYLRDVLYDFGVITDTMECAVNWSNMAQVHRDVRAYCKARPNTICMTHLSHAYPQGANLYFIFLVRMTDPEEFRAFHAGILDAIQRSGAAMSHHHGIGKFFGPWLEGSIGRNEFAVLKALKRHFDPDNIMNPGGTLGLDLPDSEKRFPPV